MTHFASRRRLIAIPAVLASLTIACMLSACGGGTSDAPQASTASPNAGNSTSAGTAAASTPTTPPAATSATVTVSQPGNGKFAWNVESPLSVTFKDAAGQPVANPACQSPDETKIAVSSDCKKILAKRLGALQVTVKAGGLSSTLTVTGVPQRHWSGQHGVASAFGSGDFSLVTLDDSRVLAWGANVSGVLGQNAGYGKLPNLSYAHPVMDANGSAPLQSIYQASGGDQAALALSEDGMVWGWGTNTSHQLAQATQGANEILLPVRVRNAANDGSLGNVVQVEAGGINQVALLDNGTVMSWGYFHGQGAESLKSFPGLVRTPDGQGVLQNIVAVSAGNAFATGLAADGSVYAWGLDGNYGTLGAGKPSTAVAPFPVRVVRQDGTPLTNIISISSGYLFTLALAADGTVWAWGDNDQGDLGQGATTGSLPYAVQVKAPAGSGGVLGNIAMVAAGGFHALALDTSGKVWAWGFNGSGELGDGPNNPASGRSNLPRAVLDETATGALNAVVSIATGLHTSFALKADGTVLSWGAGYNASLGRGISGTTWANASLPAPARNLANDGPLRLANLAAYPNLARRAR